MSDEMWRREREQRDPADEFGGPLFPDDDPEGAAASRPDDTGERRLSFGPNDTGPLPHWTDPPTGEIPRMEPAASSDDDAADDEVDVWSTFTTESPIWRDDIADDPAADPSGGLDRDMTGEVRADALSEPMSRPPTGEIPIEPPRREPGRITIGTDPSGIQRRPPAGNRRRGAAAQTRSGRPAGPARTSSVQAPPPRNLPAAIGAGLVIAAIFILATLWRPVGVVAIITIILAIAGFEYFGKVTEKGYRPAVAPGLAACVAAPLVAYWIGVSGVPLVIVFAFIAGAIGFIGAGGVESGPLPNMAVTTMGIVWIGLLGSYATLIVRWSNEGGSNNIGTDTLFVIVLGVVANDIGALLVGSSIGKTPLRAWISPGKTLEGLIGGSLLTLLVLFVVGLTGRSDTWTTGDLLILGVVIAVFAPLGDLTESMFKRNLDVKDFGALVRGHGGVLDRFDAFLFVLPVAYYVTLVLEPWGELTPVKVAIAGSSGSIGTQTLDVVRAEAPRYEVVALGVGSSLDTLVLQAKEFRPRYVAVGDAGRRAELAAALPFATVVDDLADLVDEADVVVNAVVGFAGLPVTIAALQRGKRLALANKESLIAAGPVVQPLRSTPGAELVPVDSEHCAIHQCLRSSIAPTREVARILLTASGGPFRGRTAADLADVGVEQALAHPTWQMGPKITIDSSTLMNKGLEVIEAHELFGVPFDDIDVVVHPQSVIHSMVEFTDGATIAQLSLPDMRLPIGYALGWPDRIATPFGRIDWTTLGSLDFEVPDRATFRCLDLAYQAGRAAGSAPAWLSAANEVAVEAFLAGAIRWQQIGDVCKASLDRHDLGVPTTVDEVVAADRAAREVARTVVGDLR